MQLQGFPIDYHASMTECVTVKPAQQELIQLHTKVTNNNSVFLGSENKNNLSCTFSALSQHSSVAQMVK